MAVFNPQVQPTQDPNYLNYSKPISDIPANQSGKTMLDTIGSGITDAIGTVDTAIKKSIQDKAYTGVDTARDAYTSGLEHIKSDLGQGVIPAPASVVPAPAATVTGSTSGNSLLDANAMMDDSDIPPGLDSGLERVYQLAAARAAGSPRLNDTQYAMETLSVAKQLRSQYGTGYRDYIDSEVSKASGLPVANSYYQNMLQDINRQLMQVGRTKDDIGNTMMKNLDVPGIPAEINNRRTGVPKMSDGDILQRIGDWQQLQTQYKIDAAQRAGNDGKKTDKIEDTAAKASVNFGNEVNLGLKNITSQAGVPSAGALQQYLTDVSLGRHPEATQPEITQRIQQLDAITQKQRTSLWSKGHEMGPDGQSIASTVGEERFKKIVEDALYPLTTFSNMAKDKDSGPAFMVAHQNEAILDQDKNKILINKETGPAARQFEAVRAILGDGAFPDYMRSVAAGGFQDPLATLYTQEALSTIAPIKDVYGQPLGAPRTMKDSLQHAKAVNVPDDSGYYGKTVQRVETLTDPKVPLTAKDQIVQWAFSPNNVGRLDELKMDYRDPKSGAMVPGKYGAFNILSAPKISQAIRETSAVHPENYKMYRDTVEQEFGQLYRNDVTTLNTLLAKPYLNVHFSYNSDTSQYGLVDNRNRPIVRNDRAMGIEQPNQVYLNGMLDVLDRVNGGLKNMKQVHENDPAGPGDTSQYLLQLLQTTNKMQPFGYTGTQPLSGATEGMMKAVIKSQAPDMTPQELHDKVMQYGEDNNQGPSVSQFVANPTGRQGPPAGVVKGNLSDQPLLGIQTNEIPEGMSAREFVQKLRREHR